MSDILYTVYLFEKPYDGTTPTYTIYDLTYEEAGKEIGAWFAEAENHDAAMFPQDDRKKNDDVM